MVQGMSFISDREKRNTGVRLELFISGEINSLNYKEQYHHIENFVRQHNSKVCCFT